MPPLPSYVAVGAIASNLAAISPAMPTTYRNNDLLLLFVESANQAVVTPAGWTEVPGSPQSTGTAAAAGAVRLTVFYKFAGGAEPAPTIADTGDHQVGQIMVIRGAKLGAPINASAGSVGAAATAMVFPTVTTTVPNTLIVLAAAMDTDAASTATASAYTNAALTGITERIDQTVSTGTGGGLVVATASKATAGATGTTSATGSTAVTHAYVTIAIQGDTPYTRPVGLYNSDFTSPYVVGATVPNGSTTGVQLLTEVSPAVALDKSVIPNAEVRAVGTSFTNAATNVGASKIVESSTVQYGARGGSIIHDIKNDRYIFFGGYDGTTRFNTVWQKSMKSPGQPWRQMTPTGTLPTGRNLHGAVYVRGTTSGSVDKAYMVVWGGFGSADLGDMFTLDLTTPGSEVWAAVTQTTPPSARSYITRHMVATPVTGQASQNHVYLFGGYAGTPRVNDLQRCTFDVNSPTAVTWTTLKATGAAGSPPIREGAIMDYKASTNKLYLFGGYSGTTFFNDFWSYDIPSDTWTQETVSGTAPVATELGAGGYDPVNNRFWFTTGWSSAAAANIRNNIGYIADVGGSESYVEVRPHDADNKGYSGGASVASCIDTTRNWLCIRGMQQIEGTEVYSYIIDFNETSDETYKTAYGMSEGNDFVVRDAPANVVDPIRGEGVSIAGFAGMYDEKTIVNGSHIPEVWAYNPTSNTWRYAVQGHKSFSHTEGVSAVWDSTRNRIVMFGGLSGLALTNNEVWSLTPDTYGNYAAKNLKPTGTRPTGRWLTHAVYDANRDRMLVIMGGNNTSVFNQVYALDFSTNPDGVWSLLFPAGVAPTAVMGGAFAHVPATNRMYLYGGASNTGLTTAQSQLSYFDYTTVDGAWTVMSVTGGVAKRTGTLTYDAANNYLVAFGGFSGSAELNTLQYLNLASPTAWTTVTQPAISPDARRSPGYFYINGKHYIYSGRTAASLWFRNTWELTPNFTTPNSSTWINEYPRSYVPAAFNYTGANASYHWQSFLTEDTVNAGFASFGGNAETAADFIFGAGVTPTTGRVKVFIAGSYVAKPRKVYIGGTWVEKPVKVNRSGAWGNSAG